MTSEQLAKQFKIWRKDQKLSLRAVTGLTGISCPYLSQFENGKIKAISFDYGQTLIRLMGRTEIEMVEGAFEVIQKWFNEHNQ